MSTDQKLEQIAYTMAVEYSASRVNEPLDTNELLHFKLGVKKGYTRRDEKAQQEIAELRAELRESKEVVEPQQRRIARLVEDFNKQHRELQAQKLECEKLREALKNILQRQTHFQDKYVADIAREALNLGKG